MTTRADVDRAKELIHQNREALVAELDAAGAKWASNGKECCCPFHDDHNPSAGICEKGGTWFFKCFVCTEKALDVFDVRAKRTGRPVAEVMSEWAKEQKQTPPAAALVKPKPAPSQKESADWKRAQRPHHATMEAAIQTARFCGKDEPRLSEPSDVFPYTDPATGQPDLVVLRFPLPDGDKTFRQISPDRGQWVCVGPEGLWPLFNRTRLRDATDVIVVEGEGKVKALTLILPPGWAATCSPCGAAKGNAAKADWRPVAGKRNYLWADFDQVGVEHMKAVGVELAVLTPMPEVWLIDVARLELPATGDAVDWIAKVKAAGITEPAAIFDRLDAEVLAIATPVRVSSPLRQHYADIASGRLSIVPWPWPTLQRGTAALQPGHLTAVCGEPGAGKSFFLVECLWHWLTSGCGAACLMLELSAVFHAKRLHAMIAGEPRLLDMEWVRDNATTANAMYDSHAADLDRFWGILDTVPPGTAVTSMMVLDWLRRRCRAGARVLVVDPFTALADDQPWVTDVQFILAAQQIAEEFGASIVLTLHPDRGGKRMARSEGLRRFVDTVFWLTRFETQKSGRVVLPSGATTMQRFNRTIKITKARLAAGAGGELAYDFSRGALRFSELGVIVGGDTEPIE